MINLYDSTILDIMPVHLKNKAEVQALSYALYETNRKVMNYAENIEIYVMIESVSEEILDILAVELRTQYYDETLSVEQKRKLVANTLLWYTKAGTAAAVQELCNTIFDSATLLEWFDTGGEPGTFTISTSDTITTELSEKISEVINDIKNVRSHLEAVTTASKAELNIGVTSGVTIHKVITLS